MTFGDFVVTAVTPDCDGDRYQMSVQKIDNE